MRITVFTIYIIQKKRTSAPSVPRFFKLFSVPFKSMIQLLWVLLLILYINILIIKSYFNGTFGTIYIYADSVRVFSGPPEKDLLVRIFSSFSVNTRHHVLFSVPRLYGDLVRFSL